jgi:alkylation response protein AidB-like acyl-CoA dehydrogenase
MVAYKAPVEEYMFVLHEVLRIQDFTHVPGFENVSEELTRQILEGAATFCEEVLQPLNQVGDEQGCVLENGVVRTPDGFADAYQQYCDAGWNKLAAPEKHGGAGLPGVVALPVSEFSVSANAGLALYSGLTNAAHATLARSGAAWMQEHVRPRMIDGKWTGTMCLTEPHCGTDLRLMKTKAYEQPDGTYRVTGTKIFISGGDHDLSENIIHLVLAKLPNAEGKFVDDLSTVNFFMIPKFSIDPATGKMLGRNGVSVSGVEKKMGIKGNATCVLNFEDAVAYRLAGRDQKPDGRSSSAGMAGMFAMMNGARLGTGISALAVAESASQNGATYARERVAGKSAPGASSPHTIVEYPDVRRLLMRQRAFIEGARALGAWISLLIDLERHSEDLQQRQRAADLAQLLTPVIKAYFSDQASAAANATVQIYGGHGYIRDNGVEQFVRDARIYQIFEGANGVQAFDLVARKMPMSNGRLVGVFLEEIESAIEECANIPRLNELAKTLRESTDDLTRAAEWLHRTGDGDFTDAAAGSYDVMDIFGTVAIGMMWARIAVRAHQKITDGDARSSFYERKLALAKFWAKRELPMTRALLQRASLGAEGLMELAAVDL